MKRGKHHAVQKHGPPKDNHVPVADPESGLPPDMRENDKPDLYTTRSNESSDSLNFDRKPPTVTKPKSPSVESLADHLFPAGHMNTLFCHPQLLSRFTTFLHRYRPDDHSLLLRYIETSKAIAAAKYANAVAESLVESGNDTEQRKDVVTMDEDFRKSCSADFVSLVENALPVYITYGLVKIISKCLTNEINGHSTQRLVGGLSEVFCLTDPNQHDNQIIYSSEEFYRLTGYTCEDTIGYNCRFLQGAKTRRISPANIKANLENGQEIYETILNYRRDGCPFINGLMVAPPYDDKGRIKYSVDAQVDASGLVAGGQGPEGFQRCLSMQQQEQDDAQPQVPHNGEDRAG